MTRPRKMLKGEDATPIVAGENRGQQRPFDAANDGTIAVHRYNVNNPECLAASVNNSIQISYVVGGTMRFTSVNSHWDRVDRLAALAQLPEIEAAMAFLTNNNFIGGDKTNDEETMVTYIGRTLRFNSDGKKVSEDWVREHPDEPLTELEEGTFNYVTFNGRLDEKDDFVDMDAKWFLIRVLVYNPGEEEMPHILSFHRRSTGHYILIDGAGQTARVFRFTCMEKVAFYLFTEGGRQRLLRCLAQNGAFQNVYFETNRDGQVQNVAIVPKIILFPDLNMFDQTRSELVNSFPIIGERVNLMVNQPFAISFVTGDSEIIIDLD